MVGAGRIGVDVESVSAWLAELADQAETPPWTETIRIKVARGLLAALRDFGILTGAVRKEFAPPSLSIAGFGYVAFRLHEDGGFVACVVREPGLAPLAARPAPA